jgi:tRNA dimethylallyltransferase
MSIRPPVLVLAGPTAVGKTALAIELCRRLGAEIISADSRQIYRYFDIGTAKPTPDERRLVRHHLVDFLEPGQSYSAGGYARDARVVMSRLEDEGRPFIISGGSGLYIRALVEGFSEIPPVDPETSQRVRREADANGVDALYRRLSKEDKTTAGRLQPFDRARIVRALEVLEATGRPISHWQSLPRAGDGRSYRLVVLSRERRELYRMIDERADRMIDGGLLDEVRRLTDLGLRPAMESLKAVGYREALAHLDGEIGLPALAEAIKRNSRRFAKRQLTWFRGITGAEWLDLSGTKAALGHLLPFCQ